MACGYITNSVEPSYPKKYSTVLDTVQKFCRMSNTETAKITIGLSGAGMSKCSDSSSLLAKYISANGSWS